MASSPAVDEPPHRVRAELLAGLRGVQRLLEEHLLQQRKPPRREGEVARSPLRLLHRDGEAQVLVKGGPSRLPRKLPLLGNEPRPHQPSHSTHSRPPQRALQRLLRQPSPSPQQFEDAAFHVGSGLVVGISRRRSVGSRQAEVPDEAAAEVRREHHGGGLIQGAAGLAAKPPRKLDLVRREHGLRVLRLQHRADPRDFGGVGEGKHHAANATGQQGNKDGLAGEQVHTGGDGVGEGALRAYGGIDSDFSVAGLRPLRLSSHSASPVAHAPRGP